MVLSPRVQASVDRAVTAIVQALAGLGVRLVRRDPPADADVWWARPVAMSAPRQRSLA